MKTVVNVGIGGRSFVMDSDAYARLDRYLTKFKNSTKMGIQTKEVMDDLEDRIAELFAENISAYRDVVDIDLVNNVISQLGMPDGEPFTDGCENAADDSTADSQQAKPRKLYRDPDNKSIAGVCAGLALYLNLDVALIRVLFVLLFFMGSASFWLYIFLWIVAPLAVTASQKCEMHGLPVTAENLNRFSSEK
ncbi:MAG: PspC domain-containing protein [Bacteroidales bacterium]|nr:PspC domain-containing protein [Bacteroidales bacterium]